MFTSFIHFCELLTKNFIFQHFHFSPYLFSNLKFGMVLEYVVVTYHNHLKRLVILHHSLRNHTVNAAYFKNVISIIIIKNSPYLVPSELCRYIKQRDEMGN